QRCRYRKVARQIARYDRHEVVSNEASSQETHARPGRTTMKRNPQSFRAFLDQSFRRFRELPPADVTPGWERVLDRVREYPEGLSEDVPAFCDLELPVR